MSFKIGEGNRGSRGILDINIGGPFWVRTRDLSLIRKDKSAKQINPSAYVDTWYREQQLRSLSELTLYSYRQKVEALLSECPTPNELSIKEFLSQKQQDGYYSGTIANYVKAFRSFFVYLYNRGLYNFDSTCLRLPKLHHKERRVPGDEDIAKLLSVVNREEDSIILLLLVDCGIRVHELATIKVKNINIEDASILINGKGDKVRTVYLSETTLGYLRGYISTHRSEYLFPSIRADAKIPYRCNRYFQKRLSELCERAGIEHITPHQLRHYFATHTLSNGADVKAVSEMLGHADVGITLKIYHHVNARAIRQMHNEFSPLINMGLT